MDLIDDHYCFACGKDNPDGLRLDWKVEGLITTTQFIPPRKYQGWKGILHGGIVATLLDEAMTRLAGIISGGALTAEMTVRYVTPAPIGEVLFVRGEIVNQLRRLVEMKASIHLGEPTGPLIAHSTGKAIKTSKNQ
ncbi:MAG: PaaI family thioesterase [Verrucomicrobiota bacterium]|nr:PaaI family thioesterase [Verrucomicrobiota bacterium]